MGEAILLSPRRDETVDGLLDQLTDEHQLVEDFVVWLVEDMAPHPVALELRSMRRDIDGGTADVGVMRARLQQLSGAAAAAATIGLNRAHDATAATMLASMLLAHRGGDAVGAAKRASHLHALHDHLAAGRDATVEEVATAVDGAYRRQLAWLIGTIQGDERPPARHGERFLFGDAPFDPTAIVEQLAGSRLSGPPEDAPRAVIVMGGPGAGKTTHRLKLLSSLVAIDAGEVYLQICRDRNAPFPGHALRRMNEVGRLLSQRALGGRRSIVVEVIGADEAPLVRLIEALEGIGYSIETRPTHCTPEDAARHYEAMTEDRISAFYTEVHHLAWLEGVATELSSQTHPLDEAP